MPEAPSISDHITKACVAGGDTIAIDLAGKTLTWRAWRRAIDEIDRLLGGEGLAKGGLVGLLGRNGLEQVSGFVAVLGSGRALSLVSAQRPARLVAEEIGQLGLACLIGGRDDINEEVLEAAKEAGTLLIAVEIRDGDLHFEQVGQMGEGPFRTLEDGMLIEIQTSGTTGKPKRIPVAERTFERSLGDGVRNARGDVNSAELRRKASPTLMFSPLVHTSGTINTLMSIFEVRPIVLFEKFESDAFLRALRAYRPKFVPLPPAAMKMMVDSPATRDDFESVIAVRAGTAALPIALQDAFEEKFAVPVLVTYGATEFMGTAANWTLEDYKRFGRSKRGSVGKASSGVELRVIDPQTGTTLPANEQGILEVKLDRIDPDRWVRTSDLAWLDDDGYLFVTGRADDAIIRGGFKVMAGKVADVLRTYPGVNDVIVVGMPDERLGEVPVALLEIATGSTLDPGRIREWAREKMTSYEIPARIYVVDNLPRTISDKIIRLEALALIRSLGG